MHKGRFVPSQGWCRLKRWTGDPILAYAAAYADGGGRDPRTTRQAFQERPKPGSADSARIRASRRGRDHAQGGRKTDYRADRAEVAAGTAGNPGTTRRGVSADLRPFTRARRI